MFSWSMTQSEWLLRPPRRGNISALRLLTWIKATVTVGAWWMDQMKLCPRPFQGLPDTQNRARVPAMDSSAQWMWLPAPSPASCPPCFTSHCHAGLLALLERPMLTLGSGASPQILTWLTPSFQMVTSWKSPSTTSHTNTHPRYSPSPYLLLFFFPTIRLSDPTLCIYLLMVCLPY